MTFLQRMQEIRRPPRIPDWADEAVAPRRARGMCYSRASMSEPARVHGRVWVDRLEATVEAHILPVARVREACRIPGTSVRTAFLCRDKPSMKEVLRAGGIPCAQSTAASSPEEVRDFARQVGLPVIL